jgi:hypothetical protein
MLRTRLGAPIRGSLLATVALAAGGFFSGCSSSGSEAGGNASGTKGKSIEVAQATWHDGAWPFTVSHGILGCAEPPLPGEVTFNVEGTVYGINGTALDQGLPEVNPIWRSAGGGLKVDIGRMIERGLKLCEESE